ncbi:MAG: threonine synthase [Bacteroidota bacterium]|nr:threonine synthase [Bacteroidota bacterium]
MKTQKHYFSCINCGTEFHNVDFMYLCPHCAKDNSVNMPPKGVLKTYYDYDKIKNQYGNRLKDEISPLFLPLLPIENADSFGSLMQGETPLLKSNQENQTFELFLKDDSRMPTFSFKDRASFLVSAWAKEQGIETIITASTGNAGSSLAGICASQKQKAIICVPQNAPKAKMTQILMYGARIIPVAGTYDDAFDLSVALTEKYGVFNRNTAYNPFTIEGKKSIAFELFRQMNFYTPDRIFVSCGDGVIISGVYKGFEDLLKVGLIDKIPHIVAVQAEGSNNIVRNLHADKHTFKTSKTIADSISVDLPRNFYMSLDFLKTYKGQGVEVSDDEILKASKSLSSENGVFSEPAAAAAYAGLLKQSAAKKIADSEKVVVLLSGSGLKDINAVQSEIKIPEAINSTEFLEDFKF